MDAVSLRGYWETSFKLQCWFLRLTARKFSLLLTNTSQSINGLTRKTCFSPIKQTNMCLRLVCGFLHILPIFWLHCPQTLRPSVQRERGEKGCLLFNDIGVEVTYGTSLALYQQERLLGLARVTASLETESLAGQPPPAAPRCRWGRRVASGRQLLCLLQAPLGPPSKIALHLEPKMQMPRTLRNAGAVKVKGNYSAWSAYTWKVFNQ